MTRRTRLPVLKKISQLDGLCDCRLLGSLVACLQKGERPRQRGESRRVARAASALV